MRASPSSSSQVTISVNVANNGKAQGVKTLLLKIDNNVEASQEVVLEPGESKDVTFTINKSTPGSYKASIDPLSTEFTVAEAKTKKSITDDIPLMGFLIGGFLLVVLLILIIIYRRRQESGYY
jgi:uncharacterized membrane protein